jgi:benzodiazapine receptor
MKISPIIYQLMNVIAVVAALIMNALVNILPLNGVTTAQVSDSYPNLFTPPGYVFSIWGVIYALAVVFMFYQARYQPVWTRRDFAFGLVVIWASIGIALNRGAIPVISSTSIATGALVAILILITPFLKKTGFISFYMIASSQ